MTDTVGIVGGCPAATPDFSAFIDTFDEPVWQVNRCFRVVRLNRAALARVERSRDEVIGDRCHAVIFSQHEPCPFCRLREALETGVGLRANCSLLDQDGRNHVYEFSWHPLRAGGAADVSGSLVITRDITRPAGLLAEILRLKGLAEMGKYAAELTHEIRNPLNSIEIQMTILSRLLTRLPNGLRDEVAGVVDIVRQENRRLNTLAGDFLTIRKSRQLSLSRFDVVNLLREVVVQLGPEAAGRGVALAAGGMDAGMVEGDREKLKQALINLVHNAIEAAAGVCGAAVRLACDGTDDGLKITVSDNGPGIPYEHQAKIFELFYTTKAFGTGLGLHVSRDIVAAHGGRLTFVSDPSGTVFTIRLPGLGSPVTVARP